jgi:protein SCO1/2
MRRKWIFYVGFFAVLVVGFYFTMAKVIPGYADKKFQVLNYVQPFSFTNQDGQQFTQRDVLGKVYVAEYFFTT